jgi:carbon monoxide dehydrogenase subunit G
MGAIAGRADFTLAEADGGTAMDYSGSGTIDGPLARLDSRFAERLAESLIAQGLRALDLRLATEGSE